MFNVWYEKVHETHNDKPLTKDEYLSLSTFQYLCYDFECDKDGGFAIVKTTNILTSY